MYLLQYMLDSEVCQYPSLQDGKEKGVSDSRLILMTVPARLYGKFGTVSPSRVTV